MEAIRDLKNELEDGELGPLSASKANNSRHESQN